MYPEDSSVLVYCNTCWWSDKWDGTEYGRAYDPSKPFLEQLYELSRITPYMALENLYTSLVDTEYTNYAAYQKNCYLTYYSDYANNVLYAMFIAHVNDSMDCYRIRDSELCYEATGCYKSSRVFFSEECTDSHDIWFSKNLIGCSNCVGCVNLRNKSYCIFNEKYSKEEYHRIIEEMDLHTQRGIDAVSKKAKEFWLTKPRRAYEGNSLNVNVTGDYVYESKNAHDCYMATSVEDGKFVQFISLPKVKDAYDYSGWGNNVERIYECDIVGEGAYNVKFSSECWPDARDVEYSMYANACTNCFGCVNLKKKSYCILNKQYSKEDYERLREEIIKNMNEKPYRDEKGRVYPYGEYFPLNFSLFAYNETMAYAYFEKDRDVIKKEGFQWREQEVSTHTPTLKADQLPLTISETPDTITREIVACFSCARAYRIIPQELSLLRHLNLPAPQRCPECRHLRRFQSTNPPRLYERNCAKCGIPIKTSYAPERPEIVYCEQCYNAEVA